MKRAFVLSGGGAKGAYEAGFLKAMDELGIYPDIVTGSSIGALNGCMIAQKDYNELLELWQNMTVEQVVKDGFSTDFSLDSLISNTNLIVPFFKSYINSKGANIEPLIKMVHRLANQDKLNQSAIDFGLVTVEYPSLKPIEITKKQIPQGQLADYLIASASCFPAFPIHYFNDHGYIDGGYYDNLPIHLAFKMGATEIIAVELNAKTFTHEEYTHRPNIKYIAPLNDNGGFLDFDSDVLAHRRLMGYYDTMKAYGHYLGFKYTLYPEIDDILCQHIYYSILGYEAKINRESIKKRIRIFDIVPFTHLLLEHVNKLSLDIPDYTLIILDILAELYKIDPYQIYQFNVINEMIVEKFETTLKACCDIFQTKGYSVTRLTKFLTDLGSEELICFIYLKLVDQTLWESNWIMPMFSKETLCAIYLYQYKTQKDRLHGLAI
ncbi:patatin-like phospholipase family protein [Beduini massiliensis]|uniref:patatin-like phospholipase family protein n=1 Tax=Beduini massiliensis TaxID=1585974 RepID=UPI000694A720|nr:patatin-like phospholipase family protein [Beduini massiliensis]